MKSGVHACLSRRRSRVRIPSSPPYGQIAQSVEHLSEKQGVGSSILPLATMNIKKIIYILIQKIKKIIEFFFPGYFSNNCRAIKKVILQNDIVITTVYDIGCFIGAWFVERRNTFPKAINFYLFDAQSLLDFKLLKGDFKFFNIVLGCNDGEVVSFWKDGGSGSSYFKELGNNLWNNIEPEKTTTISLSTFINKNNLQLPNYLKIDTQGSEVEILKGLGSFINSESLYFIELEMSLYQINENGILLQHVINFMSKNNFVLISTEQLPIVEYFNEKKLVQLNGVFARRSLISTNN